MTGLVHIDAIKIDFGDGGVGILCARIDIDDSETYLDRIGAGVGSLFVRPTNLTHVEGLLGIDIVEMQRGELLSVNADLQLLDTGILLPSLSGANITVADNDVGDAWIVGRELIFDPFANAIACLAFHPSGFVGEVGCIVGVVGATALRWQ